MQLIRCTGREYLPANKYNQVENQERLSWYSGATNTIVE